MKTAVVQLPGLNRDSDMLYALEHITGKRPLTLWANDTSIPQVDLVVIPGGFSYGDYLRCGAIAARTPILRALKEEITKGVPVIGVCNGFQILLEMGVLPGALLPNKHLKFVCKYVKLEVLNNTTKYTNLYKQNQIITCPVAHHDGNYFAKEDQLKSLEDNQQIVFRYAEGSCPNGSCKDIAGIINKSGNVLGMMPHPENYIEAAQGGTDGRFIFASALGLR